MKRYTKKGESDFFIESSDIRISDSKIWGNAVDQLAMFEDFFEDLMVEKEQIIEQLNDLRQAGNTKTVTFKQLFANKISVERMIERVNRFRK